MSILYDVTYDGWSFSDNGCVLTNIDHLTLPKRNNQLEDRANRDGAVLVQSLLSSKPILIEGFYTGTDAADAQNMYDKLALALNRQQRPLIIPHGSGIRTYTATPDNIIIQQPGGLNRLTFSMEFVVPDGSSEDSTNTTLISQTITTTTSTIPFIISGSEKARPLINLTFTAVTGGTGGTVSIRNAKDFVGLTFARNFVSGDTITIDSENFQIYINGVLTVPNGRFPSWDGGAGSLYYQDTFTTRSVPITTTYKARNI